MTKALESLAAATRTPYWTETAGQQPDCPPLETDTRCDLAIVGGGFTGLWTALEARRRMPHARILLVDAGRCGNAASGRNGGFCAPSISHGIGNAMQRWPKEAEALIRLGMSNLDDLEADLATYGMEVEFERSGKLTVAATPWQVEGLKAQQALRRRFGSESHFLEGDALRERLDSPVYHAGLFEPNYALLNPGKMVAELRRVALAGGVDIHEATPVTGMAKRQDGVELVSPGVRFAAPEVILASNARPPLLRRLRSALIPIFDYAIVTRPLHDSELAAIGWTDRYGIADSGNQFHYLRKTADNRILWGGFDAIYHFGSRRDDAFLTESGSFARLAENFARALPPLADVELTHAWGGIIDTSARTTFFAGTAQGRRVAYAMGFTGQGVSASRFAALTMLDLLQGRETERTALQMLRRRPFPFPPEPFRWLGIRLAQHGLAREDATGRRSVFNRTLDRFGVGFDS